MGCEMVSTSLFFANFFWASEVEAPCPTGEASFANNCIPDTFDRDLRTTIENIQACSTQIQRTGNQCKPKPLRKQRSKPQVSAVFRLVSSKIQAYCIYMEGRRGQVTPPADHAKTHSRPIPAVV